MFLQGLFALPWSQKKDHKRKSSEIPIPILDMGCGDGPCLRKGFSAYFGEWDLFELK